MAYGKRNKISENLDDFSVCILGESGIGKTTLMVEACEKEFGADGYMIFNAGKEQGIDCIEDASYEDIENWKKFDAVIKDIVKNKETDYPDLKVVVFDTLDQIIDITEPEAIRRWNVENQGKKDFTIANTINGSWGGFGRGEDKVIEIILEKVWELQKVGVRVWYTGHVKTRSIVDPITNQSYNTLSTEMMQKYFGGFKTKMHVVGIACIDRTIEVESTGRKNIVTKKDITVNKVKSERRKIVFRDDNYSVDSKSRLSGIIEEIPMEVDEFIKALKDAIQDSKKRKGSTGTNTKSKPAKKEKKEEIPSIEIEDEIDDIIEDSLEEDNVINEDTGDYPSNLKDVVKELYMSCSDKEVKAPATQIIKSFGKFSAIAEDDMDTLQKLYDILA